MTKPTPSAVSPSPEPGEASGPAVRSSPSETSPPFPNGLSVTFNGWGRILGVIGVPGVISLYLVWWLTERAGTKLDRMIQLLEQIARAVKVQGVVP